MAAPKGNNFWMLRSKHGRDRIFKTPDDMLKGCYEYIETAAKNPWYKVDYRGKDCNRVRIPTERPLTLGGLCIFLGASQTFWRQFRSDRRKEANDPNSDPKKVKEANDFLSVITHIEEILENQKLEGSMVGAYNPNIVAALLGLQKNVTTTIEDKRKETGDLFPFDDEGNEAE